MIQDKFKNIISCASITFRIFAVIGAKSLPWSGVQRHRSKMQLRRQPPDSRSDIRAKSHRLSDYPD